jgi:hypothetical protein
MTGIDVGYWPAYERVTVRRVPGAADPGPILAMTEDPRRARRPARYHDDAPLPQNFLDLATGEWVAAILNWTSEGRLIWTEGRRFSDLRGGLGDEPGDGSGAVGGPARGDPMRPLDALFADATVLFADAAALLHRARGLRQELEGATATRVDETERLVHGAIAAGIEHGLGQGLEAALRGLKEARVAAGCDDPPWLRRLLDSLE